MKRPFVFLFGFFFVVMVSLVNSESEPLGPAPGAVWVVDIDGAIGPAVSDYILRAFDDAQEAQASLIVIRMNTPGGLDNAMRDIIQGILASPIPIATYVSPQGSRAASAGTYILYASHIAAMAPATNLGAATPVQIGAPSLPSPLQPEDEEGEESGATPSTAMERKMVNDASAYIRGLAELRDRNAEWAEDAVREAASLSANEALEQSVIDLVARDLNDLLAQLNGRRIQLDSGELVLDLADAPIHEHEQDWRTDILTTLTNPNLVLILGMIGIYGIILEFYNPGSMVPGVVGVICLLLAGYSLQLLPVNYAGLGLLVFGIGLMVAEAMAPSFGIMGIGGIISFTIGGIILFDSDIEAFRLGWPAIAAAAVITAAFIIVTTNLALRMRKKKLVSGIETMIGQRGEAIEDIANEGMVRVGSELWKASSKEPLNKGAKVRVVQVDGLALVVKKEDS